MNVTIALEQRFVRDNDGVVYSPGGRGLDFWDRYLQVFDSITVVARVAHLNSVPDGFEVSSSERVRFAEIPPYAGAVDFVLKRPAVLRVIDSAHRSSEAVIGRVPSPIASYLVAMTKTSRKPYGLEVVGDPWDALAPGTVRSAGRPLARRWMRRRLRSECGTAAVVSYVTAHALQVRYPASNARFVTNYSSVDLPQEAFVTTGREFDRRASRLIAVGTLEVGYKGIDVLLTALSKLDDATRPSLVVLGDGALMPTYQRLARSLGIGENVDFKGRVPAGAAVRRELDQADLFVLPSRAEGLPRALLEAMARGMPCLASNVGGIPELLEPTELVPPGAPEELQTTIAALAGDPERLTRLGEANLEVAKTYAQREVWARAAQAYRALRTAVSED